MLPDFVIFLDENHCNNRKVLAALETARVRVERHSTHFPPATPDAEWLPYVGQKGWVLVTTDKRIRQRSLEKQAVQQHAVAMFCFTSNELNGFQMAEALTKALPRMQKIAYKQTRPFIATISVAGNVHVREPFGHEVADLR